MKKKQIKTGYPSIDKPWLKYYREEIISTSLPKSTVWQNIYERNKTHLSDTALLYFGKKYPMENSLLKLTRLQKRWLTWV